jgi:hypothetical protein
MASLLETLNFVKNLAIGGVQSDEEMTVLPLVGSSLGNIAAPESIKFRRTTTYGSMEFDNQDNKRPGIVPSHMMVRGHGAQDHAMSGSGVVLAASKKLFQNACCIESSQGGYFSGQDVEEDILPIELRKCLLEPSLRQKNDYSKLWGSIRTWLSGLRNIRPGNNRAHLRDFFDQPNYKEALEDFAAAFEPVEGQIGALILFNGVPVGLEIMPSAEHWTAYWKWLIRGCYGSQLIKLKETGKLPSSTMILPNLEKDTSPEQVKEIMTQFIDNIKLSIAPMLESIQVASQNRINSSGNMITELIRTEDGGGGDVIIQDSKPVYLSIVL